MSLHRYTLLFFAVALVGAVSSCLSPPDYPLEPVLTFDGITKDTLDQGSGLNDSLNVFISFTDGDGDISINPEDSIPSVIMMNRETGEEVTTFFFDPIPEEGAQRGISGDIRLRVFTTCCDIPLAVGFPCEPSTIIPFDTLLLEVFMQDRAGNESNRINIPPILLRCN